MLNRDPHSERLGAIMCFTIGFGDVRDSEMTELAVNGRYNKASSIDDLQDIFVTISNEVSGLYDLTYRRANSISESWQPIRITLTSEFLVSRSVVFVSELILR